MASRWLISLGCVGVVLLAALSWGLGNTESPGPAAAAVMMAIVLGLAVVPWAALVAPRLRGERAAGRIFWRVVAVTGLILAGGIAAALLASGEPETGAAVAIISLMWA